MTDSLGALNHRSPPLDNVDDDSVTRLVGVQGRVLVRTALRTRSVEAFEAHVETEFAEVVHRVEALRALCSNAARRRAQASAGIRMSFR